MKNNKVFYAILLILFLSTMACGSTEVQVNSPSDQGQPTIAKEIQVTSTSVLGTARSNPAPAGSEIVVDDMAFVIVGATRPATDKVMAGNQFNTSPEAGQEYVMVNVRITCKKSTDDKCSFYTYNLKLLGSSGIQRDPEIMVAGVDGLLDFTITEFFGGATIEGAIPFIVNSDESDLLLVYSPIFGNPFYLAIQ